MRIAVVGDAELGVDCVLNAKHFVSAVGGGLVG